MFRTHKRRQRFVDREVQGTIVLRTTTYWALCMFTLALLLLVWRMMVGAPRPFSVHVWQMWQQFGPVALASLLLLPILIVDVVIMSNRFAGPVFRLRRSLQRLADGEPVAPIRFRNDDFWQDFANDFNRLLAKMQPPVPTAATDGGDVAGVDEEKATELAGSAAP